MVAKFADLEGKPVWLFSLLVRNKADNVILSKCVSFIKVSQFVQGVKKSTFILAFSSEKSVSVFLMPSRYDEVTQFPISLILETWQN